MQCPYCETKIGLFQKPNPCPNCKKELKTHIDFKVFFIVMLPLVLVYVAMKTFLNIGGLFQHLYIGVLVGVTMLPAIMFMPKNKAPEESLRFPKVNYGKSIGIGAVVIIVMGLLFSAFGGGLKKDVRVIVNNDIPDETVNELLKDPEVQKMIFGDEKD